MAGGYDYALTDFSTQADNQTVSSTSRRSNESSEEIPPQNPFVGQTENVAHSLPAQPYDPGSGNYLLSNEHQQHQAYSHAFFREWAVEWTAWLLAALSLVALISLFLIYSGVPLRRWEAAITPATAVAILSQLGQTSILVPVTACVCQSMWLWLSKESQATTHGGRSSLIMMQKYDESRRGPISSIILLWKHPTALLVWLGTVNTLLIIIFGPFAQQSLQLPTREHNVTGEGVNTIPRALQYRAHRPAVSYVLAGITHTYGSVADLMSVAIIDGLLRQDIALSDISGNCVTGNCTWDGYQSLGVCTSVADISPTIAAKCRKKGSQFHPAGCNYSVSAIDENPTALRTVLQASEFGQTLWVGASSTVNYIPPGIDTLSQFYVIYVPNLDSWDKLDHTEDHSDQLVALQATLSLCLNTYHTNMTLGVTNTTLMGKIIDLDWQTGSEIFKEESYSTVTTMHKGGRFWMFKLNQKSFQDHLSLQTFTGTAWMSSRAEESRGGGNYTENDVVRAIAAKLYGDRNGMRGLQDLLDNLAISMSNGLRTTTDLPDNFEGTSTSFEVYIQIEWAWIIVPIATILLSLVFLLLTIRSSRQQRIPAWKSSLLAVLLGLNSETRNEMGATRGTKEMEAMAERRNVRLEGSGGRWQIVKAD